jgi:chitinase
MKSCAKALFPLLFLLMSHLTISPSAEAQSGRFVAYFVEWGVYERDYVPADIPADKLTHINYAFIEPTVTDQCVIHDTWAAREKPMQRVAPGTDISLNEHLGTFNQLRKLRYFLQKKKGKTLPLILSVGGWTPSSVFPAIAADPVRRSRFAANCVAFMKQEGFDGIDIDWEYPKSADTANFTELIKAFRAEMQRQGPNPRNGAPFLLTIAASPAIYYINFIDVAGITPYLDWVNVMTYSMHGCWGINHTGHNAPLWGSAEEPDGFNYSGHGGISEWLRRGMPADKLLLGLPYYGKAFQAMTGPGPNLSYPGRFAPIDPAMNTSGNCPQGTWADTPDGTLSYWDLVNRYVNLNGWTSYWDEEQAVPFLYKDQGSYWISYDDPASLRGKAGYANLQNLGGVFVWELSQEKQPGFTATYPLTNAVAEGLFFP